MYFDSELMSMSSVELSVDPKTVHACLASLIIGISGGERLLGANLAETVTCFLANRRSSCVAGSVKIVV